MIRQINRAAGVRFQVYNQHNGKKVYVGSYDSKRAAQEAEEDDRTTQRKIARGELPPATDTKLTLSIAAARWFKSLEEVQSRSLEEYKRSLELHVLPELGGMPLVNVRRADIITWRDKLSLGSLSHRTVNMVLGVLSSAFSYFVDREWVETNPCHGVSRIEQKDAAIYTWIQTREEITKLLVECPKGIREIVTLAVGTGMRLDELVHLQWADIDLERRLIAVHRGRYGTTKSGKARYIPILNTLVPFLKDLALKRGGAKLVFSGEDGKPRSKPGVRFPFKQAARRAGLPEALRFHDLRHTFASHWVLDAGDIFRLSKILGHANVTITQKVYAHLAPEAWEQDYHRVSFVVPDTGTVYALTRRKPSKGEGVSRDVEAA
ncbi:MAG TPA: tyrosine-type recombinase/integrase [Polyangiaceae bacterium]|nr:tyrosine-type recombinase/integrase [Polyangiaceae bacterium]